MKRAFARYPDAPIQYAIRSMAKTFCPSLTHYIIMVLMGQEISRNKFVKIQTNPLFGMPNRDSESETRSSLELAKLLREQKAFENKRIYFISDAHLRIFDGDPGIETKLLKVFDEVKSSGSHLYIVGDLFDFWFEYKFAVPAAYLKVVAALLDLTGAGIKVVYIPGNHDFWMKDFLHREAGVELVHPEGNGRAGEGIAVEHFGKRIYITHGDGLRRDDYGYRFIKRLFRNKFCIWLYSQLPVNIAYRLAMRSSKASRDYTTNRKKSDPSDYINFARLKVADGFDAVVMGHVHLPQIEDLGQGLYINCGDFFEHFSYVVQDENGFKMLNAV